MASSKWLSVTNEISSCRICSEGPVSLLDEKAFPLFTKTPPRNTEILFVAEAPNRDDTYNHNKGFLTVELNTDPSGKFFHELFYNYLGFEQEDLFLTNSVLCLPAPRNRTYPVSAKQKKKCSVHLQRFIHEFSPKIVCPVGTEALNATRLIEDHGYSSIGSAIGKIIQWYDRILFPLYHTSLQARHGLTGRSENMQKADWKRLRKTFEKINRAETVKT